MTSGEGSPLGGVRVLDLSTRLSAAFCGRLLGDAGADVVLLEHRDGHALRHLPPFLGDRPGPERSILHAYVNASKRSVVTSDMAERASWIARADIVVVSDRETADEVYAAAGPETIVTSVTAYGLHGPWADIPGNDLTAFAASGWAAMNGHDGRAPLRGVEHVPSYSGGLSAFLGTVGALMSRDQGAGGQTVDTSELEPLAWMTKPSYLNAIFAGSTDAPSRRGGVFGGPVATRDGYLTMTFSRPHFWTEAMRVLGLDELADDPRYLDSQVRQGDSETLSDRIVEKVGDWDRWALFDALASHRCTVGTVSDMAELGTNPHLKVRGLLGTLEVDGVPAATIVAPGRMNGTTWRAEQRAPRLGEHTTVAAQEWTVG